MSACGSLTSVRVTTPPKAFCRVRLQSAIASCTAAAVCGGVLAPDWTTIVRFGSVQPG
jgi:hypothetical protein